MKVIIAGSRTITNFHRVSEAIHNSEFIITEVVSGGAWGVDQLGEYWATLAEKPCTIMKAEWDKYGKRAGFIRNEQMGNYADALIAVWDGDSRGTKHMIDYMKKLNKPLWVEIVNATSS